MAAMTSQSATSTPTNSSSSSPSPIPSRNPLPLSSAQEAAVLEIYHKRVRNKCADEVRDFASCATNRTFTATFMCRAQQKAMNVCMLQFATRAEKDAAREEWFAGMDARKAERDAKEAKRKEDEVFWKEWWDKDLKKKPGHGQEGGGGSGK